MRAVLIMFGALFLLIVMPYLFFSVHDARSDAFEESFAEVATGAGATSANLSLSYNLFADEPANVNTVSSNITADTPSGSVYYTAGDILTVSGLSSNATRTLTVNYDIASVTLAELPSVDPLLLALTYWWILAILGLVAGAVYLSWRGR